jgi:hypothetical protein
LRPSSEATASLTSLAGSKEQVARLDDSGMSWSSERGPVWSFADRTVASAKCKHSASHSYVRWYVGPTVMIPLGPGIFNFKYVYLGTAINFAYVGLRRSCAPLRLHWGT